MLNIETYHVSIRLPEPRKRIIFRKDGVWYTGYYSDSYFFNDDLTGYFSDGYFYKDRVSEWGYIE